MTNSNKSTHNAQEFGVKLKDIEETLRDVHLKMSEIGKEGKEGHIPKGDRLAVRVFKEHFYTPDENKYREHQVKHQALVSELRSIMRNIYFKLDPTEESIGVDRTLENIENFFKGLNSKEDFKNTFKNTTTQKIDISLIREKVVSFVGKAAPYKKGDATTENAITEIAKRMEAFFEHYDYMENQSGYLAGVYQNNGELYKGSLILTGQGIGVMEHEVTVNKNLLTMGFVRKKDYSNTNEVVKSGVELALNTGLAALLDENLVNFLRSSKRNELADEIEKLQKVAGDFSEEISYVNGKLIEKGLDQVFKEKGLDKFFESQIIKIDKLCKEIVTNEGFSIKERDVLDKISKLTDFISLGFGASLAISIFLGPIIEWQDNIDSYYDGVHEIDRFKKDILRVSCKIKCIVINKYRKSHEDTVY